MGGCQQAIRLANSAEVTSVLERAHVLRGMMSFPSMNRSEHDSTACVRASKVGKVAVDNPSPDAGNDWCLTSPTLALFQRAAFGRLPVDVIKHT